MVRLDLGGRNSQDHLVSIHARVMVRPYISSPPLVGGGSFNPRTRDGATQANIKSNRRLVCFNPRTRDGATYLAGQPNCLPLSFNPRTRDGATRPTSQWRRGELFQSTHA